MGTNFEVAKDSLLFQGIAPGDLEPMFACLSPRTLRYGRDDVILLAGSPVPAVGLILSGRVKIVKEDVEGHSTILTKLTPPDVFGEVFAFAELSHSPVTVQAVVDTEIM